MACYGCRSTPICTYYVRECALGKGVENCGRCAEYPCERLTRTFALTASYENRCRGKCSQEEYEGLQKAFFSKKNNLDRANKEHLSQRNDPRSERPVTKKRCERKEGETAS
jgi:hypothetical protein